MKYIALFVLGILGLKLQVAFYSNEFFNKIPLFDLNFVDGLKNEKLNSIIDFMITKNLIKITNSFDHESYYSNNEKLKELLSKQVKNIEIVMLDRLVNELIFLANDNLIKKVDLPICKMIFRIIECKKNNWEGIRKLHAGIEKYKWFETMNYYPCCYDCSLNERKNTFRFRAFCNLLKNYKNQSILALAKKSICFYIKNDQNISQKDINDFMIQDDEVIFECPKKIKVALTNVDFLSCDKILFDKKQVLFLNYLH